ncbi:hypothetical protein BXA51_11830 [Enterococcus faecium]|nr:hypothetical protein BXA51_11830 [Enterococcus faecium]
MYGFFHLHKIFYTLSWIGDGSTFENLGYQYSDRNTFLNGVNKFEERFFSKYCKVCGELDD